MAYQWRTWQGSLCSKLFSAPVGNEVCVLDVLYKLSSDGGREVGRVRCWIKVTGSTSIWHFTYIFGIWNLKSSCVLNGHVMYCRECLHFLWKFYMAVNSGVHLSISFPCTSKNTEFIINEVFPLDTGFFRSWEVFFFLHTFMKPKNYVHNVSSSTKNISGLFSLTNSQQPQTICKYPLACFPIFKYGFPSNLLLEWLICCPMKCSLKST